MKINIKDYSDVFFTSDWHLGHNKDFLYGPRGQTSRDGHVKWLVDKINEQASRDALIIHLGDMSLTAKYEELVYWLTCIKCKNIKSLIGNHEGNFTRLIDRFYQFDEYHIPPVPTPNEDLLYENRSISSLGKYREITIIEPSNVVGQKAKKYPITLCHFPLLIWNHSHHGSFHLCGHSHGSLVESSPFNATAKRLDCGVENALKWSNGERVLFSWEDVKDIMATKEVYKPDHHNEETT